ncbi:MAG: hypothetical protein KTR25_06650 [Myxococcales bacterium]|nr:hypothetical protein [Myxococcales bacterium]
MRYLKNHSTAVLIPAVLLSLVTTLLVGCGANNAHKRLQVAQKEVHLMVPPSRPLSDFTALELAPLSMDPEVEKDEGKVEKMKYFDQIVTDRIASLKLNWPKNGNAGTLVFQAHINTVRIISGKSRFWIGSIPGESHIDMFITLTDQQTKQEIARARIQQKAGGSLGSWSFGASDENVLHYAKDIAYAYVAHHSQQPITLAEQ